MMQLVRDVRAAEKMLGNPSLIVEVSENFSKENFRLSCVKFDLEKNHI